MNSLLVLAMLAAIWLLLEAGYVFFALAIGVALLLIIISEVFSRQDLDSSQAADPSETETQVYAKGQATSWEKVSYAMGATVNVIGRTIYRAFFKNK